MTPPTVPAGAVITTVAWFWTYPYPAIPPNPVGSVTYEAEICNAFLCGTTTSGSGSTSSWAGESAYTQWEFGFEAFAPTTYVIIGGPMVGTPSQLSVNYSY